MIGLSTLLLYGQEIKVLDYKEKILLEDFESVQITNKSIQVQANKHYLPEVRMSKNLTSPDLQSNTSLFIRISTEGNGIPIDLSFPSPYKLEVILLNLSSIFIRIKRTVNYFFTCKMQSLKSIRFESLI